MEIDENMSLLRIDFLLRWSRLSGCGDVYAALLHVNVVLVDLVCTVH